MTATMKITKKDMDKVIEDFDFKLLQPKIKQISYGVRLGISQQGRKVKARHSYSSRTSIGNVNATKQVMKYYGARNRLNTIIKPVVPKVFAINKQGYEYNLNRYVNENPELRNWVIANYDVNNPQHKQDILSGKSPIMIRSKYSNKYPSKPPLGAYERDLFERGLEIFMTKKRMYGLR